MKQASEESRREVEQWAQVLVDAKSNNAHRYLLGLVGAPAAGKSTFSAQLVAAVNKLLGREGAIVVPMDGFHYSNEELDRRGLRSVKGIPATFDAQGFVDLIKKLNVETRESIFCPLFDRSIEASIENGIEIKPEHQIIVSEGNYLLLDETPWSDLRNLFNEIWFIDSTLETLMPRLIARHKSGGRNEEETRKKIESTDLPNAKLIESTKPSADRVIQI
jgi:pantothenate kinase